MVKHTDKPFIRKKTVNPGNLINASEQSNAKENITRNHQISSEVIKERIRANLEPLNEQILNFTQLLHQQIIENLAKTTPTTDPRTDRPTASEKLSPTE